jgi:hypothetical protein
MMIFEIVMFIIGLYLTIGTIYTLIFVWDGMIPILTETGTEKLKDIYIGIILTIIRYWPYNMYNGIKRILTKKD